jgi:hypothetical protein
MNTSYQIEEPLENLPNENVYGEVFIPREKLIQALERLGLKIEDATGRSHSSAIRFRGTWNGVSVVVNGNAMMQDLFTTTRGYGYTYFQTYNPSEAEGVTHFKLKAWLPSCVHLKGKFRDKFAWEIYHAIYKAITES